MSTKTLLAVGPSPASLHRIALFLRCAALYAWTFVAPPEMRLAGKRAPLVRGSLAHTGQAHAMRRLMAEQQGQDPEQFYAPLEAIELHAASMIGEFPKHIVEHERMTALEICKSFLKQVPLYHAKYEVLAVEQIVWFQLGTRWYTQRMDALLRVRATGKKEICDWKTSAAHNNNTLSGFAPSLQMQGYRWWGPQLFKDDWGGVKVGMLKAEPPYGVEMLAVPAAPRLVGRFPATVLGAEAQIEAHIAAGTPYDQWPPASDELVCVHRYGRCEAWDPCLWGKSPPMNGLVQFGAASGLAPGERITFGGST